MRFKMYDVLLSEKGRLVSTKFKTYLYLKNLGTLEQTLLIKHLTWNNLEQNRNKTWNKLGTTLWLITLIHDTSTKKQIHDNVNG
jgi:hypothetical protein